MRNLLRVVSFPLGFGFIFTAVFTFMADRGDINFSKEPYIIFIFFGICFICYSLFGADIYKAILSGNCFSLNKYKTNIYPKADVASEVKFKKYIAVLRVVEAINILIIIASGVMVFVFNDLLFFLLFIFPVVNNYLFGRFVYSREVKKEAANRVF